MLYLFVEKDGVLHKVVTNKDREIIIPQALCSKEVTRDNVIEDFPDDGVVCWDCLGRLPEFEEWYERLPDDVRDKLFS